MILWFHKKDIDWDEDVRLAAQILIKTLEDQDLNVPDILRRTAGDEGERSTETSRNT